MRLTITPRDKSAEPLDFFCPDGGGYVRLESAGCPGTLGRQICYGGRFTGNTIRADTEAAFHREARAWYRAARRYALG